MNKLLKPLTISLLLTFLCSPVALAGSESATPIPPVVTGTVDLEELKVVNVINLSVSHSRTFRLKNKLIRMSISDPGIAEPVMVSEKDMVLLGKSPGSATLFLWDDAGNSTGVLLSVKRVI